MSSVLFVDVSDYTGILTSAMLSCWKAAGVIGIIVRGSLESAELTQVAQAQIAAALEAGFIVWVYCWAYATTAAAEAAGNAALANPSTMAQLSVSSFPQAGWYWLDCEDPSFSSLSDADTCTWIANALNEFFTVLSKNIGIYTANWWWGPQTGDTTQFSLSPLWYANFDEDADLSVNWEAFGGWAAPVGKQYNDVDSCTAETDDDVFDASFVNPSPSPTPPSPGPDSTDALTRANELVTQLQTALTNAQGIVADLNTDEATV